MKQDAAQSGMDIIAAIVLNLLDELLALFTPALRPTPKPVALKPRYDSASSELDELEYQLFLEVASLYDLENDFLSNETLKILNPRLKENGMLCLTYARVPGVDLYRLRRGPHNSKAISGDNWDDDYAKRTKAFLEAFS